MRGRIGVRKALVVGSVLVVVGLLLMAGNGVPPFPGRHSDTSSPDPVGIPPGSPLADLGAIQGYARPLDLEADDVSAPPVIAMETYPGFIADLDDLDRNADEVRDFEPDGSTHDTQGTLIAVLLALTALKASRSQDRARRLRAETPASAA